MDGLCRLRQDEEKFYQLFAIGGTEQSRTHTNNVFLNVCKN